MFFFPSFFLIKRKRKIKADFIGLPRTSAIPPRPTRVRVGDPTLGALCSRPWASSRSFPLLRRRPKGEELKGEQLYLQLIVFPARIPLRV